MGDTGAAQLEYDWVGARNTVCATWIQIANCCAVMNFIGLLQPGFSQLYALNVRVNKCSSSSKPNRKLKAK